MKFVLLAALLLFSLTSDAFSQSKKSPVRLFLNTEQMSFRVGENTKVKLTFENRTGKTISRVNYLSVSLILERESVVEDQLGWNDSYIAFFSPKSKIDLPNRGFFETEVDLDDLYWKETASSNWDLNKPKNFFQKIMSGNFHLRAELHHSLDLWAENDSRFKKIIKSNKILITIETEKKYRK